MAAMERRLALKRGASPGARYNRCTGSGSPWSASRVERLRSCHFAYFMEYGLKAKARRAAAFDAPQIGTFLHYLLGARHKGRAGPGRLCRSGRGGPPRLGAALY